LVANGSEFNDLDGSSEFNLAVAPLDESLPHKIVSSLTDDTPNRIGVTTEVSIDGLVTKAFNVEVGIST
jgi:hypothetical protein